MLFVINATSIQLIPTAIVGVRASLGSLSPADIILPSLLETTVSTLLGMVLTWGYFKGKEKLAKSTTRAKPVRVNLAKPARCKGVGTK